MTKRSASKKTIKDNSLVGENLPNLEKAKPSKRIPRQHQKNATLDNFKTLGKSGSDVRAKCIMACGSGKTLVGQETAQKLDAKRTLLTEPSIGLVAQNLTSWQANAQKDTEFLIVCSDKTVVKPNADELRVDLSELPARVTSSPEEIAAFLRGTNTRKVVISTLHSTPIIAKAQSLNRVPRFDTSVIDEAHRTATREDSAFATILHQDQIRSRTRLFMTATPKIITGSGKNGEKVFSMDCEDSYGELAHSLSFTKAVDQGLLTDFQFVVASISEKEERTFRRLVDVNQSMKDVLAQVAFLRAAKKYKLTKTISFHSTVARARSYSNQLKDVSHSLFPRRKILAEMINGKMPTKSREQLLELLATIDPKTHGILTNCQVLKEGIDVSAVDSVVFFDRKKSEIDIVQAVGRAMRLSPNKTIGTVMVPVVVPDSKDPDKVLASSQFDKVWQVIRALKAHDDNFEARCKYLHKDSWNSEKRKKTTSNIYLDLKNIPNTIKQSISAKVVRVSVGIQGDLLTESAIIEAARQYFSKHKKLPNARSKNPVPGMPKETWRSIDSCALGGFRGLEKGTSLTKILTPLKQELGLNIFLTEEKIITAARKFHSLHKKLPTQTSKKPVPGMPHTSWTKIDRYGFLGKNGLKKGRSLPRILEELKKELGLSKKITENFIIKAAIEYYKIHNRLPNGNSKERIPGMSSSGDTWANINSAGIQGGRGLKKGRSLRVILEPLKKELKLDNKLTEDIIVRAAREYFKKHKKLPSSISTHPVPNLPNDTWSSLNAAGQGGLRGLKKGRTLSKMLKNLKKELKVDNIITEEEVIKLAREYYDLYGKIPNSRSKKPVPNRPKDSWGAIAVAANSGYRGMKKGKTLAKILEPLKKELGVSKILTEELIVEAAIKFYHIHKKFPSSTTKEPVPGMQNEKWANINGAGFLGQRGLKKGRTLAKILAPLKN